MHKKLYRLTFAATVFLVTLSSSLQEQGKPDEAGIAPFDISGKISDETGLPLPGVHVSLSGSRRPAGRETLSNSTGRFHFHCLPSDRYTLVFSLQGFLTQMQRGVNFSYPHSVLLNPVMLLDRGVGENFLPHLHINIFVLSATDNKPVPGAKVWVGDVDYGITDVCGRLAAIEEAGKYRIRVTKPGYEDFEQTVTATDVDQDLKVPLKKKGGQ